MELCHLCNVNVPSDPEAKELHESGKKHIRFEAAHKELMNITEKSVFLKWPTKLHITRECILSAVESKFGKVHRLLFRNDSNYAIVEFEEAASANKAIELSQILVNEGTITIQKRKLDFNNSVEPKNIDVNNVIQKANDTSSSLIEQIDSIIDSIVISAEQMAIRNGYMEKLQYELNKYFRGASVKMFGSSITSIGTIDSDIDASLELSNESNESDCKRDKFALMTGDALLFAGNRVNYPEMKRLSSADRARFLCKILNEIRKNVSWLGHQRPVLDARCPVVRFTVNKKTIIDLSFDNRLGRAKSEYLRTLITTDKSGNLRRLLIGFRFWALTNQLFEPLPKQHKGHFNAYMLNLLLISYLITRGVIPSLSHTETEDVAENWRIDYTVPSFDLSGLDFSTFFKDFFIDFVASKPDQIVYTLRGSGTIPLETFSSSEPPKEFKVAFMNVQDPLELSHNVCQNLCQKMISLMKRRMTYSLSVLKKPRHTFCDLLDLSEVKSDSNDSTQSKTISARFKVPDAISVKMSMESITNVIKKILQNILGFDEDLQPSFKKLKMTDENQVMLGTYDIKHELWVGRRQIKKNVIEKCNASGNGKLLSGLELEREISLALKKKAGNGTLSAKATVGLSLDAGHIIVSLYPLEGTEFLFSTIIHFLDQLLQNKSEEICNDIVEHPGEEMIVD